MTETNYKDYILSTPEIILFIGIYILVSAIYSLLFYDSLIPILISLVFIKWFFRFVKEWLINRRKEKLLLEFKEWLFSINSSLTSGYALENAISESLLELETLFGKKSLIYVEVHIMVQKLKLNVPIDIILDNFATRSDLADIRNFSQVISLVKRSGGNMINVIKNASETIGEEISLKNQISTAVSSSRYELYIMAIFPLLIIKYIDFTQPGFFEPLYHNLFGITVMTVCLAIYFASLIVANKILRFTRRF